MKKDRYSNQLVHKGPSKMGFLEALKLMGKVAFGANRAPTSRLPEVKPDLNAFTRASENLKFIWLGHSTFLLNVDGHIILVDPVFHNAAPVNFMIKRFQAPALSLEELPKIDTIVISHDHYDHLDKRAIKFFKDKDLRFLAPEKVGDLLQKWGVAAAKITELAWHESVFFEEIEFRAAPAQHFSGRGFFDRDSTLWASWIIKGKNANIYYSGDSGYGPHFKEIGEKYGPFDFAFMENGQYNDRWPDVHMRPEETIKAFMEIKATTLIPVHWGVFSLSLHHWSEPVVRTSKLAKEQGIRIVAPRFGELVEEPHYPDIPWWEVFTPSE